MIGLKYCEGCWTGYVVQLMSATPRERDSPMFLVIPSEQSLAVVTTARDSSGSPIRKEAYDNLMEIVEVEVLR